MDVAAAAKKKIRIWRTSILLVSAVATLSAFQNCSSNTFSNQGATENSVTSTSPGTGDSYDGKPLVFNHYDPSAPCALADVAGKPLPNDTLFLYASGNGQLVREGCRDIGSTQIAASDLSKRPDGSLEYRGQAYTPVAPTTMALRRALCPAGATEIPGATRVNAMSSPLDFTNVDDWGTFDGVSIRLDGVLAGLPAFRIARLANSVSWTRAEQWRDLDANTAYAFSFFARPGSVDTLRLYAYDSTPLQSYFDIDVNLVTGQPGSIQTANLENVSFSSVPFASARFYTLYFTTRTQIRGLDIGFAPITLGAGDSVVVTDPQLEMISAFCR